MARKTGDNATDASGEFQRIMDRRARAPMALSGLLVEFEWFGPFQRRWRRHDNFKRAGTIEPRNIEELTELRDYKSKSPREADRPEK